jgi:hypothetical protein
VTPAATNVVAPAKPWLNQGDIFRAVPIVRAGVADAMATAGLQNGPAMLISHGCAIDKKNARGKSVLEYLTFVPIHDLGALDAGRAGQLREAAHELKPYKALYLGHLPGVGEGYVDLTEPYTIPAALLRPELKAFTAAETGEEDDERVVATMHQTRVAMLTPSGVTLFHRKWAIQWTRLDPLPTDEAAVAEDGAPAPPAGDAPAQPAP